jgi:acyl-CoA synthetase (NDP forming)
VAGITTVLTAVVADEAEALSFLHESGDAIVLKIDSPALPHKSDAPAVFPGLRSADEVMGPCSASR